MNTGSVTTSHLEALLSALADVVAERVVARLQAQQSAHSESESLLTEAQFARRAGLSRKTLQAWRARGRGPRFVKLGRAIRYFEAELSRHSRVIAR
jgi:predicted DNA-binding transcriptional regulator AlpA